MKVEPFEQEVSAGAYLLPNSVPVAAHLMAQNCPWLSNIRHEHSPGKFCSVA